MHLTESHVYAFTHIRITHVDLTESHVMHLTESHAYAFNRITHVCIKGAHTCILHNRTCMRSAESHMYALNRITRVCI